MPKSRIPVNRASTPGEHAVHHHGPQRLYGWRAWDTAGTDRTGTQRLIGASSMVVYRIVFDLFMAHL
jgi:hypothetical protein